MPDEYDLHHFPAPVRGKKETSRAAAKAAEPKAGTIRRKVLDHIRAYAGTGRTRDEIEAGLGVGGSTVRPRVLELVQAGFVVETRFTRKTRAGLDSFVLMAAEYAPPSG